MLKKQKNSNLKLNIKASLKEKKTALKKKNIYKHRHLNTLKKKHELYNILSMKLALKRANYNANKFKVSKESQSLNNQAKINRKRQLFLINYIIKFIQKKTMTKMLKNKEINKLKNQFLFKEKNTTFKEYLFTILNTNKKLIIPKHGSANYKYLVQKAKIKLKNELKKTKAKLSHINIRLSKFKKRKVNALKYQTHSKLKLEREALLKKQRVLSSYVKFSLKTTNLRIPKKIREKNWKKNIKISYEPSPSGKSKIKVILRINKFLKRKTTLINKLDQLKKKMINNYDFLLYNKEKTNKKQQPLNEEHRCCYK